MGKGLTCCHKGSQKGRCRDGREALCLTGADLRRRTWGDGLEMDWKWIGVGGARAFNVYRVLHI